MSYGEAQPHTPDYTLLAGPTLLFALGDDATKWAAAFNQHAAKLGYPTMDEGWLTGWFANAIENSSDVRARRTRPPTTPVFRSFPN